MDSHFKFNAPKQNFNALAMHKRQLDTASQQNITRMLSQGVSKKVICSLYSLTYAELKQYR